MATIRSSLPEADTSTPVRCGRVSSREAERATRSIVSTKAAVGHRAWSPRPPAPGSLGKSSSGSVRRWNFAVPDTTSTSCCDERYSSERSSFGSERTTSSSSRPGTTASPSRSTLAVDRHADPELHVGGLQLHAAVLGAGGERRTASGSRCGSRRRARRRRAWRQNCLTESESFIDRSCLEEVGAVEMWTAVGFRLWSGDWSCRPVAGSCRFCQRTRSSRSRARAGGGSVDRCTFFARLVDTSSRDALRRRGARCVWLRPPKLAADARAGPRP